MKQRPIYAEYINWTDLCHVGVHVDIAVKPDMSKGLTFTAVIPAKVALVNGRKWRRNKCLAWR